MPRTAEEVHTKLQRPGHLQRRQRNSSHGASQESSPLVQAPHIVVHRALLVQVAFDLQET